MEDFLQLSVFDVGKQDFKIDKPIRLIELFAGIGSQAKALERLGADFEHYRTSEWEISAVASYKAIHKWYDNTDYSKPFSNDELTDILFVYGISTDGKKPMRREQIARKGEKWKRTVYNNFKATNNVGSIVNISATDLGIVNTDKYCYIVTYSFPCQDLSLAGKQLGMAKGSNTRSGLLWEFERLLNECDELPQVLILENVPQIHSKKNIEHFDEWIKFLESKGYSNFWKDMNAKNFGIPQSRNRTFMVSILGDYTYEFPQEFPLKLRLKDMLEDSVDEKYYISNERIESIISSTFSQEKARIQTSDVCGTLLARDYKDPKCVQVGMLSGGKWDKMHDISRRVYSGDGVSPTIHCCGGGNLEPKVVEPRVIGGVGEKKSNGGTQWYQQDRIYDNECAMSVTTGFLPYYKTEEPLAYDEQNGYVRQDGTVGTLTTDGSSPKHNNRVIEGVRIRKLIPLECWRLMNFDDADFEKASKVNSDTQLYKQAGNSICVCCLYYIFKQII